jgi:hypothetical protein
VAFRRIALLGLFFALLTVVTRTPHALFAISYPAGWNLVSGPSGSTLVGATGSIYTAQPGDSAYQVLAANSPLKSGWGYWAYFPSGGSIRTQPGISTYSVDLGDGATVLIGNPSAANPATVTGADVVYTYTPGGDYTISTTVPAGQGAIVIGAGTITVTATTAASAQPQPAPAQPAPAQPTPNTAASSAMPAPTTFAGLRAVALNQSDLPGYSLFREEQSPITGAIATYTGAWAPNQPSDPVLVVINVLDSVNSVSLASALVTGGPATTAGDPSSSNLRILPAPSVGDQSAAISFTYTGTSGRSYDDTQVFFRRGLVVGVIDVSSAIGTGNPSTAIAYAQIIDRRLSGASSSAPVASAPVTSPSVTTTSSHLFQASGSGDSDTRTFNLPTGSANVCVTLSGQSPSGLFGPDASLFFYEPGGSPGGIIGDYTSSGCQIGEAIDGPGSYYIEVVATPWTHWSITVDPG